MADGASADRRCPACGRSVPAMARFCGKCGCPIAPGPAEDVQASIEPRQAVTPPTPMADEGSLDAVTEPSPPPTVTGIEAAPEAAAGEGGGVGKPAFLVAVISVAVIFGGLVAWLYLAGPAPAPPLPSAAAPPAPVAAAVLEPPPPAAPLPPAAEPAPAGPPPAAQAPTGQPFQSLQQPDQTSPAVPITDAAREEEARAKAERARRRAEAKAAREALALQQAREAAARTAEPPPAPPAGPKELCAGESSFIARNSCEARTCQLREWMFHPYCMQRRQHEEAKRQGTFGGSE